LNVTDEDCIVASEKLFLLLITSLKGNIYEYSCDNMAYGASALFSE